MTARPDPYICASCANRVETRWWQPNDRRRALPPLCPSCESKYTQGSWPHTGIREPKHGAFMDRRNAMRIAALSEALLSAAYSKQWSEKHGRA